MIHQLNSTFYETIMTNFDLSPIALFVFNRPEHTHQTLAALATNSEFLKSPLFIYCDGARTAADIKNVELTRALVKKWSHPNKKIIEAKSNQGLAKSIIFGVTKISKIFGRVIVIEDDIVVSENFLSYLNAALHKYRNNPQIMQISAYMFPIPEFVNKNDAIFLPFISSWGWATWERAWSGFDIEANGWKSLLKNKATRDRFNLGGNYDYSTMLLRQMRGEIDSWAIRWNWSVFINSGLVLYPSTSLVKNIGFDGSGTHCRADHFHDNHVASESLLIKLPDNICISDHDFSLVKKALLRMSGSFHIRILKNIRNTIRRLIAIFYSAT